MTEKPVLGTVEIWEFINTTEDTHPIHLHLVRFQLLERQHFDCASYNSHNGFNTIGSPLHPGRMRWAGKTPSRHTPG